MGAIQCCGKESKASYDINDKVNFLRAVTLFKNLSLADVQQLADTCKTHAYGKGAIIYHQGDYATDFFVIASGSVVFLIDDKLQEDDGCKAGNYFGEVALLRDVPRTSTAKTASVVQVLKVSRKNIQDLDLLHKLDLQKRYAMAGHAPAHLCQTQEPSAKTEEHIVTIMQALKNSKNLSDIVGLDCEQCKQLCDAAWEKTVAAGDVIFEQDSSQADYFYIVKSGQLCIEAKETDGPEACDRAAAHATVHQVGTVSRGACFGELALLYNAPRQTTVKALEVSVLWLIDRNTFKSACARKHDYYTKIYAKHLQCSMQFAALQDHDRMKIAGALLESVFSKGEHIFEQGDDDTSFYILYEGEVAAVRDGQELIRLKASEDKVEIFGEESLIQGDPCAATMTVISAKAKTLSMDRESFEMLTERSYSFTASSNSSPASNNIGVILQNPTCKSPSGESHHYASAVKSARAESHKQVFGNELKVIGYLGAGAFGVVNLVEHKTTKATYAMKTVLKGHIVATHQQKEVMNEKEVTAMCDSNFIIRLYETYNQPKSLQFLLEVALGGELYHTYQRKKLWGLEDHAKFYTAAMVFALEHLQRKKIIYRDLKPENIMLNEKGYPKLTDMGLAKICLGKTFTICGSAPYLSPEVVAHSGYNHASDWWALGILTFELIAGHTPFEALSQAQIFARINAGIDQVIFPHDMSPYGSRHYVKSMCKAIPTMRLAMKKGGAENIKRHEWYKGFDWAAMKSQTLPPPYVPKVAGGTDLANFELNTKDDQPPNLNIEYVEDGSGWDVEFATSTQLQDNHL